MKSGVEDVVGIGVQLIVRVGGWMDGWSDKTKVILNSTQCKLKLKFEFGLVIYNNLYKRVY